MSGEADTRWRRERSARKRAEELLESKSQELYRLTQTLKEQLSERSRGLHLTRYAMDFASDAIYMLREDGSFFYANTTACRWFGCSIHEITGKSIWEVTTDSTERWRSWAAFWNELRSQGEIQGELSIGFEGTARPCEFKCHYFESQGEAYSVTLSRDISERRRAEETQRLKDEENQRLSMIAARTTNAVILTDQAGCIEWVNDGFVRMTGFTMDEARGQTPGSMLQGSESDPEVVRHMNEQLAAGLGFQVELVNYHKEGHPYWVAIEAQPLHDESGNLTQFMAVETNITERKKQAQREGRLASLRGLASEILSQLLNEDELEGSQHRILRDLGRFLAVSRAQIVPIAGDSDLINLYWSADPSIDERPGFDVAKAIELRKPGSADTEMMIRDVDSWSGPERIRSVLRDGSIRAMMLLPVVVSDRLEAVVTFEDLDRVRIWDPEEAAQIRRIIQGFWLALERRNRRQSLEREARRLSHEALIAEQASYEKSSFLANMSHEIRTPMTAIVGYADLLVRHPESEMLRGEWSEALRRNASYLLSLVTDVLDLSKIEAGELELRPVECDLEPILADILAIIRPRVREKLLALRSYATTKVPRRIHTDPTRLRQVLLNLLTNAAKFTNQGSIDVSVKSLSRNGRALLEFQVKDSGRGIETNELDRIFDKFAQGDTETGSLRGTGLGLPISRSLSRMLGGDLVAESTSGEGATFTASIDAGPLDQMEWIEPEAFDPWVSLGAADSELEVEELNGIRILVVDDNPENLRILRFLLEEIGAEVSSAGNGREGVDSVLAADSTAKPYDVVLMDMLMPVLDGYAATRELRDRGLELPIIGLTAFAMAGDEQRCRDAGCDDYLTKPIVPETLLQAVARHCPANRLGSPRRSASPKLFDIRSEPALAKLLEEYVAHFPSAAAEIEEASDRRDAKTVGQIAHRLRGTATSYGFSEIGEAASCCEDAIRGDRPWSEIGNRARALIQELNRARDGGRDDSPLSS